MTPNIRLPFDDEEFADCTVADVLADPERFEGATLADPLEGVDYGTCKARIMRRSDGAPWINSFAHGRTVYELKYNAAAVRAAMEKATDDAVVKTFVKLALVADLTADEIEDLRNAAAKRSGLAKRTVSTMLKAAQQERAAKRKKEERERRTRERTDPRPQIARPADDADWLPVMNLLNGVIGKSKAPHPQARDIDDGVAASRKVVVPKMHAYMTEDAPTTTNLPAPEQWLIKRMSEVEVGEMIERHIDFSDRQGNSVHLQGNFVHHYMVRDDNALPSLVAVATLPVVMADGHVLGRKDGFDRPRGIDFRIQPEVAAIVPELGTVSGDRVEKAMRFLTDEWLCDVATDYPGKCTIIAAALTLIERSLLDQRPCFFVTAGRRGGGKTTTLIMLIKAVTGIWPAAAAWSTNEEERRKALLSYFLYGVPYILWDNITRGTQISCPHIEKSCTAAYYSDRKLGVSEMVATAAATIHFFTGNNIGPKGDLASRSLEIRLSVDRHDPENRDFKHPDPIDWTDAQRAKILGALYTVLLGNPTLKKPRNAPMKTRFKMWWRLVGAAVEHAAQLATDHMEPGAYEAGGPPRPCEIDFRKLFLAPEDDDEDSTSLAEALEIMLQKWVGTFDAADVAKAVNVQPSNDPYGAASTPDPDASALREFLFGHTAPNFVATPKSIGQRLRNHMDEPVMSRERTLILRKQEAGGRKVLYYVEVKVA